MIKEKPCTTWDQFKRDFANDLPKTGPIIENYVFRGQADAHWGIESSFDRLCPKHIKNRDNYYLRMLSFFAFQLRQYGEDLDGKSRQDRGAIAQHYGMPTRLIDWSRSPYVAAFMAFYSAITEARVKVGARIAIWCLELQALNELCASGDVGFAVAKTRLLENDRVWRQAGLFVEAIAAESRFDKWLERQIHGAEGTSEVVLVKYTVPASQAVEALNDLILMGLTPATIYPDRDGAARYVRLRIALEAQQEHAQTGG